MKKLFVLLFVTLSGIDAFVSKSQVINNKGFADGEIIAMLRSNQDIQRMVVSLQSLNGKETKFGNPELLSKDMNIWLFRFDHYAVDPYVMLESVRNNPYVKLAQFNHYGVQERIVPDDPHYPDQWAHNNHGQDPYYPGTNGDMQTQEAWDINTGLNGVTSLGDTMVVAVIDGGIKYNHEDLNYFVNRFEIPGNGIDDDLNGYKDDVSGWDGVSNDGSVATSDHGTHVAGIIGAIGNNGKGVAGVCWGVKILPIQGIWTGNPSNANKEATVLRSYGYVLAMRKLYNQTNGAKGAFVVATNSSFGVDNGQPAQFPLWCAFYDSLGQAGILSATATTNNGVDVDVVGDIPTGCISPYMIGVGRTNPDDNSSAGWGTTSVDLGAPGFWIYSASAYNPPYVRMTGTSMATPAVAGAIALMYAEACPQMMNDYRSNPDGIALMVKNYLLGSVDTLPQLQNKYATGGRLNIEQALVAVQTYNCLGTGVHEHEDMGIHSVYPNPASSALFVDFWHYENQNISLEVFNVMGERILAEEISGVKEKIRLDVSMLSGGYYFLKLSDEQGGSTVKRFVKE